MMFVAFLDESAVLFISWNILKLLHEFEPVVHPSVAISPSPPKKILSSTHILLWTMSTSPATQNKKKQNLLSFFDDT